MIATTKEPRQAVSAKQHEPFLRMLPLIRSQAHLAFRRLGPELKEELVAEVVANAFCRFSRLVRAGKEDLAYATPLANFAIRQVIAGRRVGNKHNVRDVSSVVAQRRGQFTLRWYFFRAKTSGTRQRTTFPVPIRISHTRPAAT